MTNKILQSGLITILVILFSCSSQKLATTDDRGQETVTEQRELIQNNIKDPQKQAKLLQIVDDVEKQSLIFFNYYEKHIKKVSQLNKEYKTSREDFEKVIADFNQQYEVYLRMLILKRSDMRELTTKDEWTQIMDRESSFVPE